MTPTPSTTMRVITGDTIGETYVGTAEITAFAASTIYRLPHTIDVKKTTLPECRRVLVVTSKESQQRTYLLFSGLGATLIHNRILSGWKDRLCPCVCSSVLRMMQPLLDKNVPFVGKATTIDFTRIDDTIKEYIDQDRPGDWAAALTRMLDKKSALLLYEDVLLCRCCARHTRSMFISQ
jgi:hypothetical protein